MKIAILGDPLDEQYGGIHIATKNLIQALLKKDTENDYTVVRSKSGGILTGAEEIVVPIRRNLPGHQSWRLFSQIPKLMSEREIDIVVEPAHFGPFNLPPSIKRVTFIYDLTMILLPKYHQTIGRTLQRMFLPSIVRNADRLVTCSESTRRDLIRKYPVAESKCSMLPLASEEIFRRTEDPLVLSQLGISAPYFLYVGTIEPRKNLVTLLRAFNEFCLRADSRVQLVIVGKEGWKTEEYHRELKNHQFRDRIKILGYLDRSLLPVLYSMTRAFLYPSFYEGFGLPVLEAMSCGAPCITSKNSSLPEVGGEACLYFDSLDVEGIAESMVRLVEDEEVYELCSKSSMVQARKFNWSMVAEETINIFSELREQ